MRKQIVAGLAAGALLFGGAACADDEAEVEAPELEGEGGLEGEGDLEGEGED